MLNYCSLCWGSSILFCTCLTGLLLLPLTKFSDNLTIMHKYTHNHTTCHVNNVQRMCQSYNDAIVHITTTNDMWTLSKECDNHTMMQYYTHNHTPCHVKNVQRMWQSYNYAVLHTIPHHMPREQCPKNVTITQWCNTTHITTPHVMWTMSKACDNHTKMQYYKHNHTTWHVHTVQRMWQSYKDAIVHT